MIGFETTSSALEAVIVDLKSMLQRLVSGGEGFAHSFDRVGLASRLTSLNGEVIKANPKSKIGSETYRTALSGAVINLTALHCTHQPVSIQINIQ